MCESTTTICDNYTYIHTYRLVLVSAFYWSVAFMSPEGSKIPKNVPRRIILLLSGVPFSKHLPRLADIIGLLIE